MTTDAQAVAIRPFRESDYDATAAVRRAAFPDWSGDGAAMRRGDESHNLEYWRNRYVAEVGDDVIGYASGVQLPSPEGSLRIRLTVSVLPDSRRKGIGGTLYNAMRAEIPQGREVTLRCQVGEFDDDSLRFAEKRGFVERSRDWESVLDVSKFAMDIYEDRLEAPAKYGVTIKTYTELADDLDRDQKLYDLVMDLSEDVPLPEPFVPISFERFCAQKFRPDLFLPDACFVLVYDGRYVGLSNLTRHLTEEADLFTAFTGVHRKARRRGLAFALKVRGVQYAIEHGYKRIRTVNGLENRAMLSINECMGFEKMPAMVNMVLDGTQPLGSSSE